jgi:hypothetical protein
MEHAVILAQTTGEAIEIIDARELRIARICRDGKRRCETTDGADGRG